MSFITFGPASFKPLRSPWRSGPALRFNQKYLDLCSEDEQKSYGVWNNMNIITNRIYIFGRTIPLKWLEQEVLKEVGIDWNVFYNVRLLRFFYSLFAYCDWKLCGSLLVISTSTCGVHFLDMWLSLLVGQKLYIYVDNDLHSKKAIFFFSCYRDHVFYNICREKRSLLW